MKNKKDMKRNSGVTLIALVVTIVILLILAGISIAAFRGDKGLINETKNIRGDIEALQNRTMDDLRELANELASSTGDVLNPGNPNPDNPTSKIQVTKITLNKTAITVDIGKTDTLQITAIEPTNASDKTVTWSSNNTSIATVSSSGVVTGVAIGTATITATANDGSGIKATCSVAVEEVESDWAEIAEIAKAIANDSSITNSSTQATVTVNGESKTIKVGEIYKVKYNEEIRRVRVLGFKHDDLVNTGVYGGNHSKASISFEFYDFMTGDTYMPMNNSNTNAGGWASTAMRSNLNGSGTGIGGLGANLSNKSYIKQVVKRYIATYNAVTSLTKCNDYLWLLACSEIVNSGASSGYYAFAITSEGSQYQYYKGITESYNQTSSARVKKSSESASANSWWLRSPGYNSSLAFGYVYSDGFVSYNANPIFSYGVAPGFCI